MMFSTYIQTINSFIHLGFHNEILLEMTTEPHNFSKYYAIFSNVHQLLPYIKFSLVIFFKSYIKSYVIL